MGSLQARVSSRTKAVAERAVDVAGEPAPPGRALRPVPVAGLTVGHADDAAEHAADALAESALARLRRARPPRGLGAPEAHRHTVVCGHLRRAPSPPAATTGAVVGPAGGLLDVDTSAQVQAQVGQGAPLAHPVRQRMERAFGASLGHVQVHDGPVAARLNAAVSARAFTTGHDIFLGPGQFDMSDPVGERVLAHEIAHVLLRPGETGTAGRPARLRVQRVHIAMERYKSQHGELNQEFLRSADINPGRKDYDLAVTAAILLDHDYDSRDVMEASLDDVEAQVPAFFPGVDGDDVANQFMYWKDKPPTFLSDYLRTYIEQATGVERSALSWGPVDALGRGTWMQAIIRPGGNAEGSSAGGWNPWAAALARRADSHSTFYVRGHLLNRHLGGPGLDYNMVPLTQRSAYGGNDANAAHSDMFEEVVKRKYRQMEEEGDQHVGDLEYHVTVDGKATVRPSTALAIAKSTKLMALLKSHAMGLMMMRRESIGSAPIGQLSPAEVDLDFFVLHSGSWPQEEPIATEQKREVMARVEERRARQANEPTAQARFSQPLGSTEEGRTLLMKLELEGWGRWLKAVCADKGGDPSRVSLDGLNERVQGNLELWKLEDTLIPASLTVYARWYQYGQFTEFGPERIPVRKPDDLYSPYWHERESFI